MTLQQCLERIKVDIENAITIGGTAGKRSLIASQSLINLLHEVVKHDLVANGINPTLIHPPIGASSPEIKLAGFLKFKTQDVCVFPNNKPQVTERIDFNGLFKTGTTEPYGELFTEHVLAVNLRSQLSSLTANIDTMFERTFAEPMNLHRRLPKMVLGEVYLIALREYDNAQVALNNVVYKPITNPVRVALERYIKGFSALNMRASQRDDDFKYERVALIIADFSQSPVRVYDNTADLIANGLLPVGSNASMDNLSYTGFVRRLLDVYERRFGTGIFT